MYIVRIEKEFAENMRKKLFELGVVDKSQKILSNGDYIDIPVIYSKRILEHELKDIESIECRPRIIKTNKKIILLRYCTP